MENKSIIVLVTDIAKIQTYPSYLPDVGFTAELASYIIFSNLRSVGIKRHRTTTVLSELLHN